MYLGPGPKTIHIVLSVLGLGPVLNQLEVHVVTRLITVTSPIPLSGGRPRAQVRGADLLAKAHWACQG